MIQDICKEKDGSCSINKLETSWVWTRHKKWNWLRIRCDDTSSGCSDAMSRHKSVAPLGLHTRCGFVKWMDSGAMGSKGRGTLNF